MIAPRVLILCALLVSHCVASARGQAAYDLIERAYAPHVQPHDPLGWPMKARALASDPYTFWRGSKEHFYAFARHACADWLADRSRFIPTHGDPHFGNVGSYAASVGDDGRALLAIGFVDFDESSMLPPEMDLLQGWIMIRLSGDRMGLGWSLWLDGRLRLEVIGAYTRARGSTWSATELLVDVPMARSLLKDASKPYAGEVDRLTRRGRTFIPVVRKKGESPASDVLQTLPDRTRDLAGALARAVVGDVRLGGLFRMASKESFAKAIRDVVRRTRVKSSGSQGLGKYFVLIDNPFASVDLGSDVAVLYLKQQVATPAERNGLAEATWSAQRGRSLTPAGRAVAHTRALTDPAPILCAAVESDDGQSLLLMLRDPWGRELEVSDWTRREQLIEAARVWATVAGCAHRRAAQTVGVDPGVPDEATWRAIFARADAYLPEHARHFSEFCSDPRTAEAIGVAERELRRLGALNIP